MQQSSRTSSVTTTSGSGVVSPPRHTSTSSIPMNFNRTKPTEQSNTNENGNVFTLTNIYTFGDNGNTNPQSSSSSLTDKYHIKSFVEVFDSPSKQQDNEYERYHHEKHSSSSITRKIRTSSSGSIHL